MITVDAYMYPMDTSHSGFVNLLPRRLLDVRRRKLALLPNKGNVCVCVLSHVQLFEAPRT